VLGKSFGFSSGSFSFINLDLANATNHTQTRCKQLNENDKLNKTMNTFLKIFILSIMFFKSNQAYSQLTKYDFENYELNTHEQLKNAEQDVLDIANLLLKEPANKNKLLREDAGYFLSEWMSGTDDYNFGTGTLKALFDDKIELTIVSLASQVKYCLENNATNSYDYDTRLGIWKTISTYIGNKKNKVRLTKKLKSLVKANNENKLAEFLEANE
jgi:hypothetical protein